MNSVHSEAATATPSGPALEVKGTIAPVTVLCLRTSDIGRIERELTKRVAAAPQMFLHAPIVIDLADVDVSDGVELPLAEIVRLVRGCQLVPVGVAHLPTEQVGLAAEVGLAVVQLGFGRSRMARANSPSPVGAAPAPTTAPSPAATAAPSALGPPPIAMSLSEPTPLIAAPVAEALVPTLTIRQPVRGGQVVYGKRGDVVILAHVNPGAQVIADGHVHIYGRLRGRALAGAHGMTEARVFCQSLEPELISIAGEFLTAESIPAELRGKPAQMFIEHGEVRVAPL